ncbi:hypothetical protein GG344DRAFT_77817 [Lentinula edodes]|nr:hypothetical protein GG344DRAFT_77817 [Lentinula edodes]
MKTLISKIMLLQEEPEQITVEELHEEDNGNVDDESTRRLSTISERTERTELSPYWPHRDYLPPPRTVSTFTDSSYRNLIGESINTCIFTVTLIGPISCRWWISDEPARLPLDPNLIPVSPSGSAVHHLSTYEPAPSIVSSGSYTQSSPPHPPSEAVPPLDTIPDIPDSHSLVVPPPLPPKPTNQSSSTKQTSSVQQPSSPAPSSQPRAKQSKLAQLASSRASTRTKSSASLGTEVAGSIKTYPVLRPESHRPPSSISTSTSTSNSTALPVPPPDLRSIPRVPSSSGSITTPVSSPSQHSDRPRDTITSSLPSSTSLKVRQAVDAALELKALDRELAASRKTRRTPLEKKLPTDQSELNAPTRPPASTSPKVAAGVPRNSTTSLSTRPTSKLVLLAQAKAQKAEAQHTISKVPLARPPPPNHLPPEHTEYLTPIANGSSVTTAITTSYQTLYSLTDPTRPQAMEAPFVALEILLLRCPAEIAPYVPSIVQVGNQYIKYGPNYSTGNDEDEEMADADDDDEDADLDEDVSPVLILRFSDREETVKLEVWLTYGLLLSQTAVYGGLSQSKEDVTRRKCKHDTEIRDVECGRHSLLKSPVPALLKEAEEKKKADTQTNKVTD